MSHLLGTQSHPGDSDDCPTCSPFVCLECGHRFPRRGQLEVHWTRAFHGPANTQNDALSKAKASVGLEVVWRD